jgi:outer membrane receptor protein involved in Fe transport
MKFRLRILLNTVVSTLLFTQIAVGQGFVKGKIIDGTTGEVLVGATVVIKGTTIGAQTDYDGFFEFKTDKPTPLTLTISFVGFETKELELTDFKTPLSIKLGEQVLSIETVEIKGQRISDKQKASPLTVETMDKLAIKQTAAVSFYEGLGNLKGVDLTTASIGFTIINTRGFNSTNPVRSLQIIDGVDNQAPGLNFSLGNFLGSSELDVQKVDLVAGASSAYFGPNAFNGVISMETKNPFYQKGLAVQLKTGERSLLETALRYADAVKNSKGHDWMAYKLNFYRLQAYDWVADNYDPVSGTKTGKDNPGRYDAVNRYGDERDATFDFTNTNKLQPWISTYIGLGQFHRTGYNEIDIVNYNTRNIKANAALHFRLKPADAENSPELIASSNFGNGTTVYQGDNRFSLKNILFFQNRLELRKRDKYFLRFYATNENSGDSYDPYFTALLLQEKSKSNQSWLQHYLSAWRGVGSQAIANGYPQLVVKGFDPQTGQLITEFDYAKADKWIQDNQTFLFNAHNNARIYADTFNTPFPFYIPGTQRFKDEFNRMTKTKSSKRDLVNGGTGFYDRSALFHSHGEYRFQPSKGLNEWVIGGNARLYTPISKGTIFYDTLQSIRNVDGKTDSVYNTITNFEFGVYTGIEKKFANNKFKFNATVRLDKNQNFDFLLSPAASLVWQPDNTNYFRLSFSSAIRNPTLNDQFLFLNVGRAILAGNTDGVKGLIDVESFVNYIDSGFQFKQLKFFDINPIRPEKVKSAEFGYRTTLFNTTFIDMSYYYSFYNDFIGFQLGIKSNFDVNGFPQNVQAFRYAANAKDDVTTQGFSLGLSHYFAKFYQLSGNYSWNVLNTKTDDPIIPAFNTPEHKFNIGISGRDVEIFKLKNIGFNVNYKWIQGFTFQGSPQFTGSIPTYDLVDAQISFGFPKVNTTLKLGASNVLNKKQFQTYGGPRIGRMAYISLLYDWVKKAN